jgi:hypothetical protein
MRSPAPAVFGVLFLAAAAVSAGDPAKGKPKDFVLVNKAKDIRVLSDRAEPIEDYFRRNRILLGVLWGVRLKEVLETKETLTGFLVSSCSQNDDPDRVNTFGSRPDIAPTAPAVARLIREYLANHKNKDKDPPVALILCRDAKETRLYRVVGYLEREPRGFFDREEKNEKDGFSPKDLLFRGDPKK